MQLTPRQSNFLVWIGVGAVFAVGTWLSFQSSDGSGAAAAIQMSLVWAPICVVAIVMRLVWRRLYVRAEARGYSGADAPYVVARALGPIVPPAAIVLYSALWIGAGMAALNSASEPVRDALDLASSSNGNLLIVLSVVWIFGVFRGRMLDVDLRCSRCERSMRSLQPNCPHCGAWLFGSNATHRGTPGQRRLVGYALIALSLGLLSMCMRIPSPIQTGMLRLSPTPLVRNVASNGRVGSSETAWRILDDRATTPAEREELLTFALLEAERPRLALPRAFVAQLIERAVQSESVSEATWRMLSAAAVRNLNGQLGSKTLDDAILNAAQQSPERADIVIQAVADAIRADSTQVWANPWSDYAAALVAEGRATPETSMDLIATLRLVEPSAVLTPVVQKRLERIAKESPDVAVRSAAAESLAAMNESQQSPP